MSERYGDGDDCKFLTYAVAPSVVTPSGRKVIGARDYQTLSLQLVCDRDVRTLVINPADNVVAASHTWTFATGAFTAADVGGTLTVTGATNSNNNAAVTISSVTNATTIVTTGTQTNETFNNGTVVATVTRPAMAGTWKVEISNNYTPLAQGAVEYGATSNNPGDWTDITTLLTPAIVAVTGAGATSNQYTTIANLGVRSIGLTFTPSAGSGTARAVGYLKSTAS